MNGFRLALVGMVCLQAAFGAEQRKPRIVTSFLPIYCFTVNVAGEYAEVRNLLPANGAAHDFQLSQSDAQMVNDADVVIINGLGMESSWGKKVLAEVKGKVVEFSAGLSDSIVRDASASPNPHIWLDPALAIRGLLNIVSALQKADPAHASDYAANASAYSERLRQLDQDLLKGLKSARGVPVVTYHDAFAYFAHRYELRVVGVIEVIPEISPGPKYLRSLLQTIEKEHARVIFAESSHSLKLARQLGRDANIPVAVLDTLENGTLSRTAYEDAMRANMKTIQRELEHYASSRTR